MAPLPAGIGEQKLHHIAQEMGRYACGYLNTPVSVGIHRNAETDCFGTLKPRDEQGFRLHLLVPTRRALLQNETGAVRHLPAGEHGFGEKILPLTNRHVNLGLWGQMKTHLGQGGNLGMPRRTVRRKNIGVTLA
jgi:hypothetical protein